MYTHTQTCWIPGSLNGTVISEENLRIQIQLAISCDQARFLEEGVKNQSRHITFYLQSALLMGCAGVWGGATDRGSGQNMTGLA